MLRMRQPSAEQTTLRSTTTILRRSARPGTPAVGLAAAGLQRPRIPAARQALVCLLLAAATVAAFFPVAGNGFIDYDDQDYVTQNDHVRQGLTASGALWAFTHSFSSNWHPVTWLSHMLDCQLFGLNAGAHHATSLFFHIANSLLLFLLFARMTGALWPSALVAGLFALHPLHVESVAWISERKDLLSMLFMLLATGAYVLHAERPRRFSYAVSLVLFAMALMSKPMVVTLPLLLLLLDYWPLERLRIGRAANGAPPGATEQRSPAEPARILLEKLPFLALAAAAGAVTVNAQRRGLSLLSTARFPVADRMANACVSYFAYVGKTLWPANLAVFYPLPAAPRLMPAAGAGLTLLCATALAAVLARRRPYVLVGWLWYLVALLPVIGLVQVGNQAMADRYTYLPLVGLFVIIAWGAAELASRRPARAAVATAASVLLTACLIATQVQVRYWRSTRTLFEHALAVSGGNYVAHSVLGDVHAAGKELKAAADHYNEALRIDPSYAPASYGLGTVLAMQGDYDRAIVLFEEALRIRPDLAEAHNNLGLALQAKGRLDEALAHYNEALRFAPGLANAHYNLATLLQGQGKIEGAITEYSETLRLQPDSSAAHVRLGTALASRGDLASASAHYREAIRLKPDFPDALDRLAWLLATQPDRSLRDGRQALELAGRACRLTGYHQPILLSTLAAAYAETGRFREAAETAQRAIDLAIASGRDDLAASLRQSLPALPVPSALSGRLALPRRHRQALSARPCD